MDGLVISELFILVMEGKNPNPLFGDADEFCVG
jgi:hypothetical protein